jgi:hypothetical protein
VALKASSTVLAMQLLYAALRETIRKVPGLFDY